MANRRRCNVTPSGEPREWRPVFLAELAQTADVSEACRKAGVSRTHVYRLRAEDREFAAAWRDAHEASVDALEGVGYKLAKAGNEKMLQFYLRAHRREVYGDEKRVQHSGNVGPTVADYVKGFTELGMSRQQAIALMREAKSLPEDEVEAVSQA